MRVMNLELDQVEKLDIAYVYVYIAVGKPGPGKPNTKMKPDK